MKRGSGIQRRAPFWCWAFVVAAGATVAAGGAMVVGEQGAPPADGTKAAPKTEAAGARVKKGDPAAEKKDPGSGNYLVMPITTELQRAAGKKYGEAKVFVLINGTAIFNENDTVLNVAAIDLRGLEKELGARLRAGERGTAILRVCSGPFTPRPKKVVWSASDIFRSFLREFGLIYYRDVEVEGVQHHSWRYANDWKGLVADITKRPPGKGSLDEPGIGDEQVKLYPVRTGLSRYIYGHDVDCVIRIVPPIDKADVSVVMTMQRCLPKLKLRKNHCVAFLCHWDNAQEANYIGEELSGEHVWKDLLGFKTVVHMIWN